MPKRLRYEHLNDYDFNLGSQLWYDSELQLKNSIQKGELEKALTAYHLLEKGIDLRFRSFSNADEMLISRIGIVGGVIHFALRDAGVPASYLTLLVLQQRESLLPSGQYPSKQVIDETLVNCIHEACEVVNYFSMKDYSPLIKKCIKYITNHLTDTLSVTEIAKQLNITRQHLSVQFKKETSMTITEYINKQRIYLAKKYLQNHCLTISQVSLMCGYNDITYFERVFKKSENISPRQYRIINTTTSSPLEE